VSELERVRLAVGDAGDEDRVEALAERGEDAVGPDELERGQLRAAEREREVPRQRALEPEAA